MARRSAAEAARAPPRAARDGADALRDVRGGGQLARAPPLLGRRRHRCARRGLPSQHGRDRWVRGARGATHQRADRQPGGGRLQGSEALRGRHRDHHQESGPARHPQPLGAARPLPRPGGEGAGQAQLPGAKAGARQTHAHGVCMCMHTRPAAAARAAPLPAPSPLPLPSLSPPHALPVLCLCSPCALPMLSLCSPTAPTVQPLWGRCSSCATSSSS